MTALPISVFRGPVAGVLLLVAFLVPHSAWAIDCFRPRTPTPEVEYVSPPKGASFLFKITSNPDTKHEKVVHQRYIVKSIDGDAVHWRREPVKSQGQLESVTLYRAFARLNGNGWNYEFDLAKYDRLWPLKQGNEASYVLSARKDGKEVMKLKAEFCVRGSKVLGLPAGRFTAHLIDISQTVVSGPPKMAWDTIEVQAWYVPEFGTALLMQDRVLKKGKVVMVRRREAVEVKTGG